MRESHAILEAAYECYYFRDKDDFPRGKWPKGQIDHGDHTPDECPTIIAAIEALAEKLVDRTLDAVDEG